MVRSGVGIGVYHEDRGEWKIMDENFNVKNYSGLKVTNDIEKFVKPSWYNLILYSKAYN